MEVRWAALLRRFKKPLPLVGDELLLEPAPAAPGGEAEIEGHPCRVDRARRGVPRLAGEGAKEARHDERLMTDAVVATSELANKASDRRARVREADIRELDMRVRAHFHEGPFTDERLHLSGSPHPPKAVSAALRLLPIHRGAAPDKGPRSRRGIGAGGPDKQKN